MKALFEVKESENVMILRPDEKGFNVLFEGFDTIKPLFDYVLIEKDEEKKTTNGGLVLPDNSKEKPSTGTVVAVGNGNICENTGTITPMFVKVGDRVIFPKLAGQTVKVNSEEKTMLKQTSILGIIE